jgi:hypothetical protein
MIALLYYCIIVLLYYQKLLVLSAHDALQCGACLVVHYWWSERISQLSVPPSAIVIKRVRSGISYKVSKGIIIAT